MHIFQASNPLYSRCVTNVSGLPDYSFLVYAPVKDSMNIYMPLYYAPLPPSSPLVRFDVVLWIINTAVRTGAEGTSTKLGPCDLRLGAFNCTGYKNTTFHTLTLFHFFKITP